jgi:hypothetical protein
MIPQTSYKEGLFHRRSRRTPLGNVTRFYI